MNPARQSTRAVQRAKRSLHKKYGDRDWFRGVGIVPTADGPGLRLNVKPSFANKDSIPATYYNFPVEIVEIRGYEARKRPVRDRS